MKVRELTGDEPEVFNEDEVGVIEAWQDEELSVAKAVADGVPPWHLTPVERLPNLTDEERAAAAKDPDAMPLADLLKEEEASPLLRELRTGGGRWLQEETIRRLEAIDYWETQATIEAMDASGAKE